MERDQRSSIFPAQVRKKKPRLTEHQEEEKDKGMELNIHFEMENLPTAIQLDIFSRLPAESVLQCKRVRKTWCNLLHNNSYFAHMQLKQSLEVGKLGLLYLTYWKNKGDDPKCVLYYGDYDHENDDRLSYKNIIKRINHPPIDSRDIVVGSCNGLICFTKYHDSRDINDPVYIIFNPMIREYVNLRRYNIKTLVKEGSLMSSIVSGFGYITSSDEYKVVRIIYCRDCKESQPSAFLGYVQVYSLGGDSGWRNKGKITFKLPKWRTVFANGALYWLDQQNMKIVVFDLAEEEFCMLPLPSFVFDECNRFQLRVVGELLCYVHEKRYVCLDIWVLKEKQSSATDEIKEQEYHSLWSWHKDFTVDWGALLDKDFVELFSFTKTGEILLCYDENILCRYDLKTATTLDTLVSDLIFFDAIPHLNSLVSLKALGEEDAKIIQYQQNAT